MPPKKKTPKPDPVDVQVRGDWYQLDAASPDFLVHVALCAAAETRTGTCDQLLNMALGGRPLLDMKGAQIWPRHA